MTVYPDALTGRMEGCHHSQAMPSADDEEWRKSQAFGNAPHGCGKIEGFRDGTFGARQIGSSQLWGPASVLASSSGGRSVVSQDPTLRTASIRAVGANHQVGRRRMTIR
jgi:hypothetical protein